MKIAKIKTLLHQVNLQDHQNHIHYNVKITKYFGKYKKIGIIGSGAFGNVYKAKYNNEYFAIKEITKIKIDEKKFLREIEVMKKIKCDNSVKFIESVETEESFYIVSEFCHLTLAEY